MVFTYFIALNNKKIVYLVVKTKKNINNIKSFKLLMIGKFKKEKITFYY